MKLITDVIETPNHFFVGPFDFIPAEKSKATKVKKLDNGMVEITKTFIANSYEYKPYDQIL